MLLASLASDASPVSTSFRGSRQIGGDLLEQRAHLWRELDIQLDTSTDHFSRVRGAERVRHLVGCQAHKVAGGVLVRDGRYLEQGRIAREAGVALRQRWVIAI